MDNKSDESNTIKNPEKPGKVNVNDISSPAISAKRRAVITLTAVLFLAGGFMAYAYFVPVPEQADKPAEHSIFGTWLGVEEEFGEELYIQFNEDGTMFLASPEYSYGAEFTFHPEEDDGLITLEIFDSYNERWIQFIEIEQVEEDALIISVIDIGEFIKAARVEDELFEELYQGLEHHLSAMELVYGTFTETGLAVDEEFNIVEPKTNFDIGEEFYFYFYNAIPFNSDEVILRVVDSKTALIAAEISYDVEPDWLALINEEPLYLSDRETLKLVFVVSDQVRAVHEVSAE